MSPGPRDWHDIALARLTAVMGETAGRTLTLSVLSEVGLERIASAAELRQFAGALGQRGGFASAVGAMLGLHATMYEHVPSTPPAPPAVDPAASTQRV